MANTEFTCRASGSNLNAGTLDGSAEAATAASATLTNGAWNGATLYTAASGSDLTQYTVGRWCALWPDGTTGEPVSGSYSIGRISAVNGGTRVITLTAVVSFGTIQGSAASGKTLAVGGAFLGPNGTSGFPTSFLTSAAVNSAGNLPRINYKTDQTYSVTSGVSTANANVTHQGYTSSFGDGGKAILDGGTSGASYVVLTVTGAPFRMMDFKVQNNGATGSATLFVATSGRVHLDNVVIAHSRGFGLDCTSNQGNILTKCEVFDANQSNTASLAGARLGSTTLVGCNVHDNTGSNTVGILGSASTPLTLVGCVVESNGLHGIQSASSSVITLVATSVNNNGVSASGSGLSHTNGNALAVTRNSIFTNNTAFGRVVSGALSTSRNDGYFGNTSGATSISAGSPDMPAGAITLTADPYTDAPNGDFSLNSTSGGGVACAGTGYGTVPTNDSNYTKTTTGYPDVGAVQHQDGSISGGGGGSGGGGAYWS